MKKLGVPLVEKPEEMIGKVDAMLIEAVDGTVHLERARPFLEAGLPCFIDKPFTCSVADGRKLIALAAKKNVPIFSSSSLRYAPEVVAFTQDKTAGKLIGCTVYSPASLSPVAGRNDGLFHYGIHGVEVLYTLMGPGCQRVTCVHERGTDVVTGTWKDGRVATLRGIRDGAAAYGFTAFSEKGVKSVTIKTDVIYRELCKKIVETFERKASVLDPAITLEIVAFMAAANASGDNHGTRRRSNCNWRAGSVSQRAELPTITIASRRLPVRAAGSSPCSRFPRIRWPGRCRRRCRRRPGCKPCCRE